MIPLLSPCTCERRESYLLRAAAEREKRRAAAAGRGGRARPPGSRLRSSSAPGVGERAQPAVADQRLVDGAEPAGEGRVDGHAERDRLAVHRPARRDDEVGERDQALRVDGVLGDDAATGARAPGSPSRCSGGAREDDGVHGSSRPSRSSTSREERVPVPVVERDLGRRAHDDEHARRVDARRRAPRVRLEVGEVVLLLDARVADELRRPRAEACEPVGGIASGTTTRVAARQPSWCWSVANS